MTGVSQVYGSQVGRVAGVDGWRGGWVIAVVCAEPDAGRVVDWRLAADAAALISATADCVAVGVDVPIGLTDAGGREADRAARTLLRDAAGRAGQSRASSVFSPPIRPMLAATTYPEACAVGRAADGRGLSIQAWHITGRIADLDAALRVETAAAGRLVEVHPEVSFTTMAGTTLAAKRTVRGVGQRLAALAGFVDPGPALAAVPPGPALDDALDALACAWTADRWERGAAFVLPPSAPTDRHGLPMRIVV